MTHLSASVILEVSSSDSVFTLLMSGIARYLQHLGVSVAVNWTPDPAPSQAVDWLKQYGGIPYGTDYDLETAQVVVRLFPKGYWPARPVKPYVVDVQVSEDEVSGDADFNLVILRAGKEGNTIATGIHAPTIPESLGYARYVIEKNVTVFLGFDPLARSAGIVSAIQALGYQANYITAQTLPRFWHELLYCEVAVTSFGFVHWTAVAMGIPQVVVALNDANDASARRFDVSGAEPWIYLGRITDRTDAEIAEAVERLTYRNPGSPIPWEDAVNDLRETSAKDRRGILTALAAASEHAAGTRQIAEWIYRTLVGTNEPVYPAVTSPPFPHRFPVPKV